MKKIFILSLFSLLLFSGCNDLDIAPKNLITDKDLIGSESGMDIYMVRLLAEMTSAKPSQVKILNIGENRFLCCVMPTF